ncbi:MAG: CarD family transcriptional regulator [Arhodomonas sp.]|nr:CarD family transcriptional regulator [Arhodomonas sp.]
MVHEDHGVGRYRGLQTLEVGGVPTEFLTLEYAGGDKLYVPVASLHLVSRYTGLDTEQAPLHRLGCGHVGKATAQGAPRQVPRRGRRAAGHLRPPRAPATGTAYPAPTRTTTTPSADGFPLRGDTADQQSAIDAVLDGHGRRRSPWTGVVCGDVGFGKTEVAMRAAFIGRAAAAARWACWCPPPCSPSSTTRTSATASPTGRCASKLLSRLRGTPRSVNAVLAGPGRRQGRHRHRHPQAAAARRATSHDLGLVIVDEEHRFGVRHKEKLKALRAEVDMLTLTATPIPRTLNMSLSGLRDLSIIATPPARRLAVKTFVSEWNDALVQEACLRELHRGGQVYFLHNEVESIERMAAETQRARAGGARRRRPRPDARARAGAGDARLLSPALQRAGAAPPSSRPASTCPMPTPW